MKSATICTVLRREICCEGNEDFSQSDLDLIRKFKAAGVELYVCGEAHTPSSRPR